SNSPQKNRTTKQKPGSPTINREPEKQALQKPEQTGNHNQHPTQRQNTSHGHKKIQPTPQKKESQPNQKKIQHKKLTHY
ncbi:hypothetical protein, partial [Trueperella sp.]|uniref:hypothetical protein n=1 Tax=Trueperella sp. TaxID=2699835 RepID=UPI0037356B17